MRAWALSSNPGTGVDRRATSASPGVRSAAHLPPSKTQAAGATLFDFKESFGLAGLQVTHVRLRFAPEDEELENERPVEEEADDDAREEHGVLDLGEVGEEARHVAQEEEGGGHHGELPRVALGEVEGDLRDAAGEDDERGQHGHQLLPGEDLACRRQVGEQRLARDHRELQVGEHVVEEDEGRADVEPRGEERGGVEAAGEPVVQEEDDDVLEADVQHLSPRGDRVAHEDVVAAGADCGGQLQVHVGRGYAAHRPGGDEPQDLGHLHCRRRCKERVPHRLGGDDFQARHVQEGPEAARVEDAAVHEHALHALRGDEPVGVAHMPFRHG
mmetsp:Transcript_10900/g.37035  ORF Transcript_10900/g.37035 Transcript_10900/m.37035 type:complete len:329 (-) Transcript_10900:39-1025(-)